MVADFSARECFSVYSEDFAGSDRILAGKDSGTFTRQSRSDRI
jgi:hypothetical protein